MSRASPVPWLVLLLASPAFAAEPVFTGTDKSLAEAEAPKAAVSAELGGTWTSGNTDSFTLNGGLHAAYLWSKNRVKLDLGANLGQAYADLDGDGHIDPEERALGRVETARRYFADTRYDRFVGESNSLYLLAGAIVDPFAGYDTRSHVQIGLSHAFLRSKDTVFVGEIGGDVAYEDYVAEVDPNSATIVAARGLLGVEHRFNPNVAFTEQLEVYENLLQAEDLRVLSRAAITATLTPTLSLKLSHQLTFDNVPVDGFRKVDQTTMATFVATLLQS